MQIDSTQAAGLLAFLPATLSALAASRRRDGDHARFWSTLAVIDAAMATEVILMFRHDASRSVGGLLAQAGLYADRRSGQAILIGLILCLALLTIAAVLRRATTRSQRIAAGATFAAVLLFLVESVSLHAIDATLYRPAGPILLIGWLWLAAGWLTAGACLGLLRRSRSQAQG